MAQKRPQGVGKLPEVFREELQNQIVDYVAAIPLDKDLFKLGEYGTLCKARAVRGSALAKQLLLLKSLLTACPHGRVSKPTLVTSLMHVALHSNRRLC